MTPITPILKSLGLLESEIKTYMAALENGAGTAVDLSKQTGLSRQAVYSAIESLTERGIMSSVMHGKKKLYSAEDPVKLLAYARRREQEMKEHLRDLERSIPELKLQMGKDRPVVKVFEGKEGIRAVIEEMKEVKSNVSQEISDLDALKTILTPDDLKPLRQQVKKQHIRGEGIYSGMIGRPNPNAERYLLPPELGHFKSNISIYDDKFVLVSFEGRLTAIVIESATLTRALRVLFQLAFETARRKFPKK